MKFSKFSELHFIDDRQFDLARPEDFVSDGGQIRSFHLGFDTISHYRHLSEWLGRSIEDDFRTAWNGFCNSGSDDFFINWGLLLTGPSTANECYRTALEECLIAETGLWDSLDQCSGYINRKRNLHPVQQFQIARSFRFFSHISDAELSVACSDCGPGYRHDPPRNSLDAFTKDIEEQYGLLCASCGLIFWRERDDAYYIHCLPQHWEDHSVCEGCALTAARAVVSRAEQARVREKQVARAVSERKRQIMAAREARDNTARQDRHRRETERMQIKMEKDAAYLLVKELGVIDLVRKRTGWTK